MRSDGSFSFSHSNDSVRARARATSRSVAFNLLLQSNEA